MRAEPATQWNVGIVEGWKDGEVRLCRKSGGRGERMRTPPEYRLQGLLIYDFRLLIVLGKETNRGVFCRFSLLLRTEKG